MRRLLVTATLAFAVSAAPASAATIASPTAVDRSCTAKRLTSGAGFVQRSVVAAGAGTVTARLDGADGDWDLAVFDSLTGRLVAGSAYRGSPEVAVGYVTVAGALTMQACRVSRGAGTADLAVTTERATGTAEPASDGAGLDADARARGSSSRTWDSTSPSTAAPAISTSCCTAPATPASCGRRLPVRHADRGPDRAEPRRARGVGPVRELRRPAGVVLRGPRDHGPGRRGDRQRARHDPRRVAVAGERLRQ